MFLCILAYFTVRLYQLTMAERRSFYMVVCLFALHGSAKGFEAEGQDQNNANKLFPQEQCLAILATDLETYNGMLSKILNLFSQDHIFAFCLQLFQILEHLH